MTITQIKYFITAAKCLNFTKAADQLFITQPALSRQITSLETELNMLLFLRSNRSIHLTPAGVILMNEFSDIYETYITSIEKAKNASKGMSGSLKIGVLDGTDVSDFMPSILKYFNDNYSNIQFNMCNYSFKGLIDGLYFGDLDLIFTLYFDIEFRENVQFEIISKSKDHIAMNKNHHLGLKNKITFNDLKDETLLLVSHEDSETSANLIINTCKNLGFYPALRYAPSIQTLMLWVESGMGVAILDSRNELKYHPNILFVEFDSTWDPSLVVAWHRDKYNPSIQLFLEELMKQEAVE